MIDPGQAIARCLDELRAGLPCCGDSDLVQRLQGLEDVSRRVYSVMLDAVAEIDSRRLAVERGFGNTARLLTNVLQLSTAEAKARVAHAGLLGPRRAMSGEALGPVLPATGAALAAGQIGTGQVRVIADTIGALPSSVPVPIREQLDADLARHAREFDPRRLRAVAQRVVATLDPDGPEPDPGDDSARVPVRGELWLRPRRDGGVGLEGWLDAEHGAMFRSLIDQLAAPHTAADGVPDPRTLPQRQADALIELADRARAADDFPASAGEPPHLTVTLDWEALRTAVGAATLDYGQVISATDARRMACDSRIIPVVLGGEGEPLDVGRAQRTVPRAIRRALVARDKGCVFPGCDTPPSRCDGHHLVHWADGGETSVHNTCLMCRTHHNQVHHQGWDLTLRGVRVEFRPPSIIDPNRRPRINPLRQ